MQNMLPYFREPSCEEEDLTSQCTFGAAPTNCFLEKAQFQLQAQTKYFQDTKCPNCNSSTENQQSPLEVYTREDIIAQHGPK